MNLIEGNETFIQGSLDYVRVRYMNVCTRSFMSEVIRTCNDYPTSLIGCDDCLYFVIVGIFKGQHLYKGTTNSVFDAVLMDASRAVFRARLSQNIILKIGKHNNTFKRGSVVAVSDYNLVWFQGKDKYDWRVVMMVNDLRLHTGPYEEEAAINDEDGTWRSDLIEHSVVSAALNSNTLQFLTRKSTTTLASCWKRMTRDEAKKGMFINRGVRRAEWVSKVSNQEENACSSQASCNSDCDCRHQLGLKICVLSSIPFERVIPNIYRFSLNSPKTKRRLLREYYAIHFFSLRHGAYKFPICFLHAINETYPNPITMFFPRKPDRK